MKITLYIFYSSGQEFIWAKICLHFIYSLDEVNSVIIRELFAKK